MRLALLSLVLCSLQLACEPPPPPAPRWLIARRDVEATDDRRVHLRRGFGIAVVEARASGKATLVHSSLGSWFPLDAFEPVPALAGAAPAPLSSPRERPVELKPGERWIEVDLSAQRLIAYEGDRPVRGMKISSGVGADAAPYSTPKGLFRIYAKLRATTMASEPPYRGDPADPHPYRFEGVPDVQYFNREIALHGAYWHRRFGERVSHGCVNLSPVDAAWLFEFTSPEVRASERERAVAPGKVGSLVLVH